MDRTTQSGTTGTAGILSTTFVALLALLLAGGCAAPSDALGPDKGDRSWKNLRLDRVFAKGRNLTDRDLPYPWEKEIEFLNTLTTKPVASVNDGIKALVLFLGGSPWGKDPEELARGLVNKGIFDSDWAFDDDMPLTKGMISTMICQACGIRGGLWMTLFGPSQRYCNKEAVYLEIVNAGSLHRYVDGMELLNIISEADLYREKRDLISRKG